ncbi:UNVERIFIED_CONTAM: hypothetical protein Sangu_0919200 [Sesamum angustifolium]|uniref:Uncharacterized protein n=1 Tax=Sesamum angustifolium TaxID=2727405 RepID=A0AAW2PF14_9LAMI
MLGPDKLFCRSKLNSSRRRTLPPATLQTFASFRYTRSVVDQVGPGTAQLSTWDDITFRDPLNTFTGIERYKLIFWALRFHGRILFREISLDVLRIWQPSEYMILIRWNLKGVPRVPWEAKGEFQGTSRYKLDRNGKIYEHKVDNLAFNFPQTLRPAVSVLDLVAACPASPNPTFLWGPVEDSSSSWVEFYRAVKETLDREELVIPQDCLATCS